MQHHISTVNDIMTPRQEQLLLNVIHEERENVANRIKPKVNLIRQFALQFTRQYISEKGLYTDNGKVRIFADAQKVEKTVRFYEACINADDKDIPVILADFGWTNQKRAEQLITGRGNTGKITTAWKKYKMERNSQ